MRPYEDEHREDVLDDQPSHGRTSVDGLEGIALDQSTQQHDGTGHRKGQAEHQTSHEAPPHDQRQTNPERGGGCYLYDGTRDGDPSYGKQVTEAEMDSDAEHQQDHADLRQLSGNLLIGYQAGSEGTEGHSSEQVAHDRWQPKATGDKSSQEGSAQPESDGADELAAVLQGELPTLSWLGRRPSAVASRRGASV